MKANSLMAARLSRLACCAMLGIASVGAAAADAPAAVTPRAQFWHVGIVVQDLERMHAFYTQVLQLQPVTDLTTSEPTTPGAGPQELRVPGLDQLLGLKRIRLRIRHVDDQTHPMFLELLQYVNHGRRVSKERINQPGLNHLGLEVTELDAILARIRTTGLGSAGPVVTMPMFNGRLVIVRDPEGNVLELRESLAR